MVRQASNESFRYNFLISVEKMEKNRNLSPDRHSEVGPNFVIMGFRGKIAVLRHLEWFLVKSEESRPPLKWPILGGSTFFTFFQKPLLVPQNCNFTSKTQNYKIRSNFGVPVRTQILIFFHFFNRYQQIIPKTFI